MKPDGWILFWGWAFGVGLISFFVLVIVVIPFGARDLLALFKHLNRQGDTIRGKDRPR